MVSINVMGVLVVALVGRFPYCTSRLQHFLQAVADLSHVVSEFKCGCLLK